MTVMRRVLLFFCLLLITICNCEDLYEVLGISRTADKGTIKRAYTKLAKKWHPDKNRSPEAASTMTKINKAYEVLSNDARRRRYDLLGEESDKMPSSPSRGNSFDFGPFSFHAPPSTAEPTDQINSKQFMETIISDSYNKPYLIYYYHDFCPKCRQYTEKWEELRKDFHNLGLGTASVQVIVSTQATLYSKIYLNEVPKIALMTNGKVHHYNGVLNLNEIKIFIDTIVPSIVEQIYTLPVLSNNSRILNNKPFILLVSPRNSVSLNYKIITFTYQRYCDFFFISSSSASNELLSFFKLQQNDKQLFIYKELEEPAVTIKDSEFSTQLVKNTIIENKLLFLPRISLSLIFDSVCPHGVHIRTCLLLVVEGTSEYTDFKTNIFRRLATKWTTEDFGLSYIDAYRQISFLTKFYQSHDTTRKSCDDGSLAKSILILRRSIPHKARYKWYHSYCGTSEDEKVLKDLALSQEENLENSIYLDPITDEDINLMNHFYDYFYHYWEKIMALIGLPLPMLLISCYLFLFPKRRERQPHPPRMQTGNVNVEGSEQHLRNRQGSTNEEESGQHIQDGHDSINAEESEQHLKNTTDVPGSGQDGHSFTNLEKSEQHEGDEDSSLNEIGSERYEEDEDSYLNEIGSEHQTVHKSSHSKHSNNREKTNNDRSHTKQNS